LQGSGISFGHDTWGSALLHPRLSHVGLSALGVAGEDPPTLGSGAASPPLFELGAADVEEIGTEDEHENEDEEESDTAEEEEENEEGEDFATIGKVTP
jgi:hypothetical protein